MKELKKKYENIKKSLRNEKGITLVALIITIIVLLILAGVSISFVFNGGILDKTQSAVNEYEDAADEEKNVLDKIDKYLEDKLPKIPEVDENGLAKENTTITTDDPNVQIVIPKGFAPVILQTGKTSSMPGENGSVKEIMPASDWNSITKEDINKGIVVVDNAITYTDSVPDFNEYVWIPIVDSGKFKRVAWTTPNGHDENGDYVSGDRMHLLAETSTLNRFWEETASSEYTRMVSSVNLNKGFYISRYEASMKDSETAQSRRGQLPWSFVSQTTAITASRNMKPSINSHLLYGIEWDSVLQWLLDSQAKIGADTVGEDLQTITLDYIQKDNRNWGSYRNSIGYASTNAGVILQPGGTSEYWKVNNIYDLAGNSYEWTQEKYSTGIGRVCRGGAFINTGDNVPSANRRAYDESSIHDVSRVQGRLLCIELYSGSEN